jgi:hypothetical protein
MHQTLADQDRADAHRFRTYAAVPAGQRPPMPPIPADIRHIDPDTIWPALTPQALNALADIADQGAAIHDATNRDLTARHQHPKRPR